MEADGPPQRAGAPERVAEDHGGEEGHDDADGVFARVVEVSGAEEERHEEGGDGEGDGAGVGAGDSFGEAVDAAGEGVLEEAAAEVLLEEADGEEGGEPLDAGEEDRCAVEGAGVEDEEMGGAEDERRGG